MISGECSDPLQVLQKDVTPPEGSETDLVTQAQYLIQAMYEAVHFGLRGFVAEYNCEHQGHGD